MKKIMPIIAAVMLVLSLAFWAASADEPMDVRLVDAPAEEGSQTGTGDEALNTSGSAITAAEEERDIFALPWDELTPYEQQQRALVEAFAEEERVREEAAAAAEEAERELAAKYEAYEIGGSVSMGVIERAVLGNNLTVLGIEENIAILDEIDYSKLYEDLRKGLNTLSDAQWALQSLSSTPFADSYRLDQVKSQYDTLSDQFEDIKTGKMQSDNAGTVWMLRSTEKQLVMAAENLFMTQKDLELTDRGLARQLAALERTGKELDVRYEKGQVSKLAVSEFENGVTQLKSGRKTLEMNISLLSMQLKNLLGASLDKNLRLEAPALPTGSQLAAMDPEKDLNKAKEASYSLYDAKKTLDQAEEDWMDIYKDHYWEPEKEDYKRGEHTWKSAQYTYDSTVNSFELSFRTLYYQVKDNEQIVSAAREAVAQAEKKYQADALRYQYGQISQNELKKTSDSLEDARDKLTDAGYDLISSYNTYMHAVNDGIIN